MRIGVDIRGLLTGKISGVEQYTLQLLRHLLMLDQHNTYVFFYVSYKDLDQRLEQLLTDYPYLHVPNVKIRKLRWINFPILLHAFFKPLNWPKADIVCGGLDVMWMPSPMLLPLSQKCAKVTTFHDLIFLIYPQFYTLSSRIWQWQMNYSYEARTSDAIIAVSNNTKNDLVRLLKVNPDRIHLVYEGVDENYFISPSQDTLNSVQRKFNLPSRFIYYVGSIEPRKNLSVVVKALAQMGSGHSGTIKLVISGSKEWLSSDLYKLVGELGLEDQVIFTGQVSESEKIALLHLATALVFPSIYEGFGLMVLEAFAAGCPVITSRVSSLPEVAGDAALLIDDPYDVDGLVSALERLLGDFDLRRMLIAKGRDRAREFSWERSARETLQVIEGAVQYHGG